MKTAAFGLDIGTVAMKVVWLGQQGQNLVWRSSLIAKTPPKGMASESPFDQEAMVTAVRKIVNDAKITTRNVHISLADNQVFTKVIEMPMLSDKELSSAIYWEAEQYIPSPLPNMTLDWRVLRRDKEIASGSKMQVLLVAAPTLLIKKYQRMLELAGLSIDTIETDILSVVRSIVIGKNFPTTLIINMGNHTTSLAIVKENTIIFTYAIPVGGIAINQAIATSFNFTIDQAEEYKKVYGIADQSLGGKIGKAIEPILISLLTEVKKAHAFYDEKYKNESPIGQIVLSGGSAKLPGIDIFFVRNVGIETVISNPWKMFKVANVPKEIIDNGAEFSVAFGLAMKDYE